MSTELVPAHVIDVYTDTVADPRERSRDFRLAPHPPPGGAHDFRTPPLPTPLIERPAVWPETTADRDEIVERVEALEVQADKELRRRVAAMVLLLDRLETFPGDTWQQRWLASGADCSGESWADGVTVPGLLAGVNGRAQLTGAAGRMVLLGALRPAYQWLDHLRSGPVLERFRAVHDPEGFAALDPICDARPRFTVLDRRSAYHQLTRILMQNGGRLVDITLADCIEAYRAQVGYSPRQHSFWYLLLLPSRHPARRPPTDHLGRLAAGQLTVEELVDGYDVACQSVRDLHVDYLHERQASLDYRSLRQLASKLVLLFWRDLELHEPGIDSLHLSDNAARRWKERLRHVRYGKHGRQASRGPERHPHGRVRRPRSLGAGGSHTLGGVGRAQPDQRPKPARPEQAEETGEVEGLEATIAGAEQKLASMQRAADQQNVRVELKTRASERTSPPQVSA